MIRVAIADDHDLVREGMKKILGQESDIRLVSEARLGAEVLGHLERTPADVLILDISLPDLSGLDLLRDIRRRFRSTAVLIVSMHPEDRFAVRAIRAGAAGYLTKETAGDRLIPAVRRLASGGKFITDSLAQLLANEAEHPANDIPHERLSEREFDVFLLLAGGSTVSQVAERLNVSVSTVSTYRTRILEKLGFRTNAELTRYAFSQKLIE